MEISQHIKNLLLTNERVILNGFGAFDSKHIPARIDKESKTMIPPYKIVVFNPDYKESEGLLAKHMATKEEISEDSANEQIEEYVKTIKAKLNSGEKVIFPDLGEMVKTPDGKYDFSYKSEDNLLLDAFGLPKVSLSEQDKIKTAPPKKDLRKAPLKKTPEKPKKATEKPKLKEKPKSIQKQKPAPIKKQKPVKEKKDKPKKKKGWLALLIILGLLGILLVAVYFFKPDLWKKGYNFSSEKIASVKKSIFGGNKDDLEIIIPEEDTNNPEETVGTDTNTTENQISETADDTTSTEEVLNREEIQEDNQTSDIQEDNTQEVVENNSQSVNVNTNSSAAESGKYYIIIGSVKTEASAQKEQKRYAKKGITTEIVYASKLDRYRISIGKFSSAKAAQDFFTDFENKYGKTDAWVWKKR